MSERTLFMVKPDAMAKGALGGVLSMIREAGLTALAGRIVHLAAADAERFYAVHKARPFFPDLVAFMSSGPVFVGVLEGENAIARWRDLMGPTDATKAPAGTVRAAFGTDVERNAVHGSDAPETAKAEIGFFFRGLELPGATATP